MTKPKKKIKAFGIIENDKRLERTGGYQLYIFTTIKGAEARIHYQSEKIMPNGSKWAKLKVLPVEIKILNK